MGKLNDSQALTRGMHVPREFSALFEWIESAGYDSDQPDGLRHGSLFSEAEMIRSWDDNQRAGGTDITFIAEGNSRLKHWFRTERRDVLDRLCVFAQTGAEGSMAAFWLDPVGQQKIVHLGSGSGSIMTCVLAEHPVDFLRLLAIGYDEICWDEAFNLPPNANPDELFIHPNRDYQRWLSERFQVRIPETGAKIVKHIARLGDVDSPDQFNRWVAEHSN